MRVSLIPFLVAVVGLAYAQRIKATFGILEGNGTTYPHSGLFYRWEDVTSQGTSSLLGSLQDVEPFGNDLAYDPQTKLLFIIGGGPNAFTWKGSVYALDIWRSSIPLPVHLDSIGARRLAVWDTLLLVTRNRAPYFTAYRISYDAQQGSLTLDSLWSPASSLLRNVPDGLLVWGDTAFVTLSYDASTYAPDSLVLAIHLRTRQVVGSWQVYPNPTELVRIKDSLYVACQGNFGDNLRIARIVPSQPSVQIWDAGYQSYGGFVTDTGGVKDTILFWSSDDTLRAFAVRTGQTAPGAYLGIASGGLPFFSYGLLRVGRQLWMSFTNYADTSLIILRDPDNEPAPPHLDTLFVANGFGGIGYPSLRRFIYVEDDTVRGSPTMVPATGMRRGGLRYEPGSGYLVWTGWGTPAAITVWSPLGQVIRRGERGEKRLYVGDLPGGVYVATATDEKGGRITYRFWKP